MTEFAYRISVSWSPEDDAYVASVPTLDVHAHGARPDGAVRQARAAADLMIESLAADGLVVPPADGTREFSGNIRLRISKRLHRRLVECAQDEGVSLNTLMATLLAAGVGERTPLSPRRAVGRGSARRSSRGRRVG